MYYLPKFGYVEYIVATCGVESLMKENTDFKDFVQKSLSRFHRCDWARWMKRIYKQITMLQLMNLESWEPMKKEYYLRYG